MAMRFSDRDNKLAEYATKIRQAWSEDPVLEGMFPGKLEEKGWVLKCAKNAVNCQFIGGQFWFELKSGIMGRWFTNSIGRPEDYHETMDLLLCITKTHVFY